LHPYRGQSKNNYNQTIPVQVTATNVGILFRDAVYIKIKVDITVKTDQHTHITQN